MNVLRIAAFSDGEQGGNPAGVSIGEALPPVDIMQTVAAEVGFSETAFAAPEGEAWRVRYFSPESEVPFCGHATIALGAALALQYGDTEFALHLNETDITVQGQKSGSTISAALQSPATRSAPAGPADLEDVLELFGLQTDQLDPAIAPALIHGGANHFVLVLKDRETLAAMNYDLPAGRELMRAHGLVTIMLVYCRDAQHFDVRIAFASGGVFEDPATGAAAAAFAGYLRDLNWPHDGKIQIVQGEDMGMRSIISAEIGPKAGSSIRVSGTARLMS
jgi:PhzF family phenazine biosynthesis protein